MGRPVSSRFSMAQTSIIPIQIYKFNAILARILIGRDKIANFKIYVYR